MTNGRLSDLERSRELLRGFSDDRKEIAVSNESSRRQLIPAVLQQLIFYAGFERVVLINLAIFVVLVAFISTLIVLVIRSPWPLLAIGVAVGTALLIIKQKIHMRAESFERDYTALLLSLAPTVRTGQDPFFALASAHTLFAHKSELKNQLLRFKEAVDEGLSEEAALSKFGADIQHPDIDLFREAFILSRRQGCSISACLHRLAKVTRQRQSFRRRIRGAVAMQKLSAFGIAGCVILVGIFQCCANPEAVRLAVEHPLGQKLLGGGIVLVFVGLMWMLRMCKARI